MALKNVALLAAVANSLIMAADAMNPQPNTFEIVGNSGVSALMLFLSRQNKVYFVDKTENNPNVSINGHPAWGTEYDVETNQYRPMDLVSNSFCAGGNVLGNGTWLNVGGNQAITYGGLAIAPGQGPYQDLDGGKAIRMLDTCDDGNCEWSNEHFMTTRRWYPTIETLEDGSAIILGGCDWGGYVPDQGQNNPTYEFFPSRGGPVGLNILSTTLPANLFPYSWLLPSGNIFINSNWGNELFDYKNNIEHPLPDIPHSVRTYPASAANIMLPLTPANNWTATLLFCGGTNLQPNQWVLTWNIAEYPTDDSCVRISPDTDPTWKDETPMPEGRVMGNFISLPDGRILLLNGIGRGTAGYGNTSWAIGQSFGQDPIYSAHYYDYSKPDGQRFSGAIANSTVDRMYHSTATLLADGSVLSAGSNPNADYVAPGTPGYKYFTEYRVERFYPDYYNEPRPQPNGIPDSISYGGNYFNITLPSSSLRGGPSDLDNTRVVLIRPGFSTHAMNMGQRYVQLNNTYTYSSSDKSAVLHVSQMPPNPAILVPGPAMLFVVVNGVPSNATWVTVGNGQIGQQPLLPVQELPAFSGGDAGKNYNSGSNSSNVDSSNSVDGVSAKSTKSSHSRSSAATLSVAMPSFTGSFITLTLMGVGAAFALAI